ncbi:hypothetical protein E3N88_08900 [Mikania micrantha]|uniref:Uncharacterized protein n=1 Tax=Mikania micrantha TaxID=192012 RepID=A0A5N6PHM3_9ASTR|nr:hypothetical protein E3N88_08900 [Mikania micrantha]
MDARKMESRHQVINTSFWHKRSRNECSGEREQLHEKREKEFWILNSSRYARTTRTLSRYATLGKDHFTPDLMMPVDPTILSGSGTRRATRRVWRCMSRYATGLEIQKIKFMFWKTGRGGFIRFLDDQRRH